MTKRALFWRLVLFTLAVSQLVSNCTTDNSSDQLFPLQQQQPWAAAQQPSAAAQQPSASTVASGGMARGGPGQPSGLSLASGGTGGGDYRIAPRDILQITVFQVQDLNNTVQVSEDGTITLPLVGKIQLSGETTYEAEQTLTGKLRKYLQSPQVSISVKTYGKRITVSGEVKTPNVVADDGNTTLTQAIAGAGGLGPLGDSSRVHIARSKDQRVQDEIYNLNDVQAGKVPDPVLRGGDIIVVETSGSRVALNTVKDLLPFAIFASLI
jgi:polysaccharide biosynthesis/export protein